MGRVKFPELLRAAGIQLTTLAERYGVPADEDIGGFGHQRGVMVASRSQLGLPA